MRAIYSEVGALLRSQGAGYGSTEIAIREFEGQHSHRSRPYKENTLRAYLGGALCICVFAYFVYNTQ